MNQERLWPMTRKFYEILASGATVTDAPATNPGEVCWGDHSDGIGCASDHASVLRRYLKAQGELLTVVKELRLVETQQRRVVTGFYRLATIEPISGPVQIRLFDA